MNILSTEEFTTSSVSHYLHAHTVYCPPCGPGAFRNMQRELTDSQTAILKSSQVHSFLIIRLLRRNRSPAVIGCVNIIEHSGILENKVPMNICNRLLAVDWTKYRQTRETCLRRETHLRRKTRLI